MEKISQLSTEMQTVFPNGIRAPALNKTLKFLIKYLPKQVTNEINIILN